MDLLTIAITLVVVVGLFVLMQSSRSGVSRAATAAMAQGEVGAVVQAIERLPEGPRPTAFNQAMRQMWDAYERGLAIQLLFTLRESMAEAPIFHYWIKQSMEVEPDLARDVLDADFMARFFDAEVASKCGPGG